MCNIFIIMYVVRCYITSNLFIRYSILRETPLTNLPNLSCHCRESDRSSCSNLEVGRRPMVPKRYERHAASTTLAQLRRYVMHPRSCNALFCFICREIARSVGVAIPTTRGRSRRWTSDASIYLESRWRRSSEKQQRFRRLFIELSWREQETRENRWRALLTLVVLSAIPRELGELWIFIFWFYESNRRLCYRCFATFRRVWFEMLSSWIASLCRWSTTAVQSCY